MKKKDSAAAEEDDAYRHVNNQGAKLGRKISFAKPIDLTRRVKICPEYRVDQSLTRTQCGSAMSKSATQNT